MSNQDLFDKRRQISCLDTANSLSSLVKYHVMHLYLNENVLPVTDIRFSKWANMLVNCHVSLLASIASGTDRTS